MSWADADDTPDEWALQAGSDSSKTDGFSDTRSEALARAGVSEHAGFPNPAMDRSIQTLDLNRLLIRHSAATYLMRIEDESWRGWGIYSGDIVVVDRALSAGRNDLVVWWQGDSFTIGARHEVPEDTETWGIVTATLHRFRKWPVRS